MSEHLAGRFWAKLSKQESGCWLWTARSRTANGYGVMWADLGDGYRSTTSHRIAYFLATGRNPRGLDVMHSCDVRLCCNPAHLSAGTRQENMDDMMAKGRYPRRSWARGERQGVSKLTEETVRQIRQSFASGASALSLAKAAGVNWSTVKRIVVRKTWAHVQ